VALQRLLLRQRRLAAALLLQLPMLRRCAEPQPAVVPAQTQLPLPLTAFPHWHLLCCSAA
jgi:hypothetical protein